MALGSGFYKGEKKKKKKGESLKSFGVAPIFTPPSVVPKGKNKF